MTNNSLHTDSIKISGNQPLQLILDFLNALEQESIHYCHWKSNNALDRSANGVNDLDLLIDRSDTARYSEILFKLGFKQGRGPTDKQAPGILDYYGYDPQSGKIFHVHTHYQLTIGHDMTKNFHLPVEKAYLASVKQQGLFPVPQVEFEYIVFVIRMMLKHGAWDSVLTREGHLKKSERVELMDLQARSSPEKVIELLRCHFPTIEPALFHRCVRSLEPGSSARSRISAAAQLQKSIRSYARLSPLAELLVKFSRRTLWAIQRRLWKSTDKARLDSGGAMVAIIGGDGAGKTTAIDGLKTWLSGTFNTACYHLGKPAWTKTTAIIRTFLKVGQIAGLYPPETSLEETVLQKSRISPGYPWLIREACRARDRYLVYRKAQKFAAKGGVVIFDRFPLPQNRLMDGPQSARFLQELTAGPQRDQILSPRAESRFTQWLIRLEESYYRQMAAPELIFVLRLDPEIAVQRKTDEEPGSVWLRSTAIWNTDWSGTGIRVIDAGRTKEQVLAELKERIWSGL